MAQQAEDPAPDPATDGLRTSYAADRTILANERTYAAWIRTGLAALVAGVAFEKFLVNVMPGWGIRSIALILIAVSAVAFAVAAWRYTHLGLKRAHPDVKAIPAFLTTVTSVLLVICSLIAFIGLWIMDASGGVIVR